MIYCFAVVVVAAAAAEEEEVERMAVLFGSRSVAVDVAVR